MSGLNPWLLIMTLFFLSCAPASFMYSPDNFKNQDARLFLRNGKTFEGKLSVHNERFSEGNVKLYMEGDVRPMRFKVHDVSGYQIGNEKYHVREIKGGLHLRKQNIFVKRLTPDDSRIHLFEGMVRKTKDLGKGHVNKSYYEKKFFIDFPDKESQIVWESENSRFPNKFGEEISRLVSDCTILVDKIQNQKDGYVLPHASSPVEKQAEVLLKIIEDYNSCR
jgi:hypothetical protein